MYLNAKSTLLLALLATAATHVVGAPDGTDSTDAGVQSDSDSIVKNLAPEAEGETADITAHHKKCHKVLCPSINPNKCCKRWDGFGWCQRGVCHCGRHCPL